MTTHWSRMPADDSLGMVGPRKHCVRARRVSGRKSQLRRCSEILPGAVLAGLEAAATTDSLNHSKHVEAHWTLSSGFDQTEMRFASSHLLPISPLRRHDLVSERRPFQGRRRSEDPRQGDGGVACVFQSQTMTSPFSLGYSRTVSQDQQDWATPLPPIVHRMERAGSPLSPLDPFLEQSQVDDWWTLLSPLALNPSLRSGLFFASPRTMAGGSRACGGGDDGSSGPTSIPSDMAPGEGGDGDLPSSYTFRRRNAIVEGSEDAPKSDDFPDASPN